MMIVQVNYTRPEMPRAEWEARYTDDRARQFLAVPGLQWKIWLDGEEDRRAGGIYLFADAASADAYLQMHRARLLGFGIPLVNAKLFDINLPLSLIDRAPLS